MTQPAQLTSSVELRRSTRLTFSLPVKIRGRDADGNAFTEQTRTIDINECGGKLQTRYLVKPRDRIYVENPMLKVAAMATIAWVGPKKHPAEPWEIGIALEKPQNLWGIDFPAVSRKVGMRSIGGKGATEAQSAVVAPTPLPGTQNTLPPGGPSATRVPKLEGPAALRRSTRLTFSVPITISGRDANGTPFTEQTYTISVNKHGGKLLTGHSLKLNDPICIENPKAKLTARATVAWIGQKKNPSDLWEIGIALAEPQNIWGIEFPPDDWKEPLAAGRGNQRAAAPAAAVAQPASVPLPGATPNQPPGAAGTPGETQVGVAPPVLTRVARNPDDRDTHPSPRMAAAPLVPTAEAQAAAQLGEQMKLLAEAHSRLFQKEFADLAAGTRESLQKEIQQMVESAVHEASAKVRQQMQHDLEEFSGQIAELERQAADAAVSGLRKRLAAMLAALDTPPGNGP